MSALSPCRAREGRKTGLLSCQARAQLSWEGGKVEFDGRRTTAKVSISRCLVSFHHLGSLQHRAVQRHGSNWVAVADLVQRSPADCSDRYRQHLQYQGTKRRGTSSTQCCLRLTLQFFQGTWSLEEESQLLHAIEELAKVGMTDTSARGFWVSVSKTFSGTRTPKQCRNKWCVIGSTHLVILY